MNHERVQELFQFIKNSPSCFHAINNIRKELLDNGFVELTEGKKWSLEAGKNYFVTRNQSSVIAFKIPCADFTSFHISASHSDAPCYKLKENHEMDAAGKYVVLNTEPYGGMIASTWFDRP
ncbi:MAG: M18 family aminopeptidase, partial [Oscillospiraceae bacterium]|nr:M18 family aminopeptidase [Oscillospiraceae bacterium]